MIIENLAKKHRFRVFKSAEYSLHSTVEHEYDLELHLKGDKKSFISLYDPDTLYVYLSNRPTLIKNLRKSGFYELEGNKESVFRIPISQIDQIESILQIVKKRGKVFNESEKEQLRDRLKSIRDLNRKKANFNQETSKTNQKGIITPYEQ